LEEHARGIASLEGFFFFVGEVRLLGGGGGSAMASRDFLGVFGGGGGERRAANGSGSAVGGESDEIELSLGLSLGGRFGTDMSPDAKRARLARSSSIASVCSVSAADGDPSPAAPLPLLRTSSLPTETEEERWRRREMQNRRRLEARRKRLERRISVGSSSVPNKPGREDGGDGAVNRLQLRRSIGSQGSSSANPQDQGISSNLINFGMFNCSYSCISSNLISACSIVHTLVFLCLLINYCA
jgi:hypothetical protein